MLEESHKGEMKLMQDRLHLEMEEKVKKLRAMHLVSMTSPLNSVSKQDGKRRHFMHAVLLWNHSYH